MSAGTEREAEAFRRRVRQLLDAGFGISAIAKETGKTYRHTKQIVEQERAALAAPQPEPHR